MNQNIDSYFFGKVKGIKIEPPHLIETPEDKRALLCQMYLDSLGYSDDIFTTDEEYEKHCNKYYNVKEYESIADRIYNLKYNNQSIPQELIDYMLKIKKIREDNKLC